MPGGYDHNFVLCGPNAMRAVTTPPAKLNLAAWVHEPRSGRIMELLTDAPGLQFYTGADMRTPAVSRSRSPSPLAFPRRSPTHGSEIITRR